MLGQATASLERFPRRSLQRFWGVSDINARQKWRAVWLWLSTLPSNPLRLLDAGCGTGSWSLELAARRRRWTILGLDRQSESLEIAEARRTKLGLNNVSFVEADFMGFRPHERFDVILSVLSAHYLVEAGSGPVLFREFSSWLKPDGLLILLGPRRRAEMPTSRLLPPLVAHSVFGRDELDSLCRSSGLIPEEIRPIIGRLGTLAKQISKMGRVDSTLIRTATYPLQLTLDLLDGGSMKRRSAAWLVVAKKNADYSE